MRGLGLQTDLRGLPRGLPVDVPDGAGAVPLIRGERDRPSMTGFAATVITPMRLRVPMKRAPSASRHSRRRSTIACFGTMKPFS